MFSQLREKMRQAGIVGAGGAGFPSYAKLTEDIDTLIINGAECEPLLYTDYMLMRDHMDRILDGAKIIMECADIRKYGASFVYSNYGFGNLLCFCRN